MNGVIPDKVPHFELVFQVPEQAFGLSWPTEEEVMSASPRGHPFTPLSSAVA